MQLSQKAEAAEAKEARGLARAKIASLNAELEQKEQVNADLALHASGEVSFLVELLKRALVTTDSSEVGALEANTAKNNNYLFPSRIWQT